MNFKSTGRIIYDPKRPGLKHKNKWWCILTVNKDLSRYIRYWVNKELNPLGLEDKNLLEPSWGSHISIIRGEEPKDHLKHLWKKYHNKIISFEYKIEPQITDNQKFCFIEINCPEIIQIRDELKLFTRYPPHLTVGKFFND